MLVWQALLKKDDITTSFRSKCGEEWAAGDTDLSRVSDSLRAEMDRVMRMTQRNTKHTLTVCFSYTARYEIAAAVRRLGEACDEVEYWGREAWQPVPAHADIDERCARERGQLRFPAAVLVVYVQVEPGLRAPTVLWAELPGGAPVICAVPAVAGRLLRFDGEPGP